MKQLRVRRQALAACVCEPRLLPRPALLSPQVTLLRGQRIESVPLDPAFIGQINVYLSAVDDLLRHPGDKPTIGLLPCRSKDRIVVEYALRDLNKPIGVAGWETKIVEQLPENLKGSLWVFAEESGTISCISGVASPTM